MSPVRENRLILAHAMSGSSEGTSIGFDTLTIKRSLEKVPVTREAAFLLSCFRCTERGSTRNSRQRGVFG